MSVYVQIITANNLSTLGTQIDDAFEAVRSFERGTTTPGVLIAGAVWEKTNYAWAAGNDSAWLRYTGSAHALLLDPRSPQINAGGTVPMAADLAMGTHKITGLADGVAGTDAVNVAQVQAISEEAWTGNHDAGGFLLTDLGSPESQTDDEVVARYTDCMQSSHALMMRFDTLGFDDNTGGGTPTNFNKAVGGKRLDPSAPTSFCPSLVKLRISGAITEFGGGALGSEAAQVFEALRFGDESGWITLGVLTTTGVTVQIQWRTTLDATGRGLWLRLKKNLFGTDHFYSPAAARAVCFGGVGFSG